MHLYFICIKLKASGLELNLEDYQMKYIEIWISRLVVEMFAKFYRS